MSEGLIYQNPDLPIDERVDDLLARMTLEEQVHQLASFFPNANVRLGIPHIQQGECLHGVMAAGATSFPQAIALGSTWDPDLIERIATVIAKEARALGIHHCYTPMLGVVRDVRWGRTEESYGEDPYLVSRIGVAVIRGLQGRGPQRFDREHVIATAKHFCADGEPPAGDNGAAMEISERALHEVHLPPFRAAIQEARVGAIMPAHHSLNGVPCHANPDLLVHILREGYGFDGFLVSDNGDIRQLHERMRVSASPVDSARMALEAGVDTELAWMCAWDERRMYGPALIQAVARGEIPADLVTRAARRALRAKFLLGLFDDESPIDPTDDASISTDQVLSSEWAATYSESKRSFGSPVPNCESILNDPAHDQLALEAARKALVLLKNEAQLLPLDVDSLSSIAVIGPNAAVCRLGGYSTPEPRHCTTILDGIRTYVGDAADVTYVSGCNPDDFGAEDLEQAVRAAASVDVVVLAIGGSEITCKENEDRDDLDLIGDQQALIEAVVATGTPVVAVLLHGRPNTICWVAEHVPAILEGWYLGQEGGTAIAETLFGANVPGGRLPVTVPRTVGQVPCFYNRLPTGRPLKYYDSCPEPLFPFGHGLSYTTFAYGEPVLASPQIGAGETTGVQVSITNTGDRAGDEVVQLYIRDDVSSLTRPNKELKGFQRIAIQPRETRQVTFPIGPKQLAFWKGGEWIVEPGTFGVFVGSSSIDVQETKLTVT